MSTYQSRGEKNLIYFVTFTCYNWIPLFEFADAYDLIYKWFEYLHSKGNRVTGFVTMPNHFHGLIYISPESKSINKVIGNAKRFLAYGIVKKLEERKCNKLLNRLKSGVSKSDRRKGKKHQVFNPSFDAKSCFTADRVWQKLNYTHKNPVSGKWSLVNDYRDYIHSSAAFYELGHPCVFPIIDFRDLSFTGGEIGGYF